jgi:26S proteasome regulatory subunit N2
LINSHNDSILSSPSNVPASLAEDASFPAPNPVKKEAFEKVDPRLQDIVERMFRKCYETEDYKPAMGIAIEARRLDVVEEGIKLASQRSKERKGKVKEGEDERDGGAELMDYVLDITMGVVQEIGLREKVCYSSPFLGLAFLFFFANE